MDLSQHDMEELRQAAEKTVAFPNSPHARRVVMVDADKLLCLLDVARGRLDPLGEMRRENATLSEENEKLQRQLGDLQARLSE